MKIIIWGAGDIGEWLYGICQYSHLREQVTVAGFADNNQNIKEKVGNRVYSLSEVVAMFQEGTIDAVVIATKNIHVDDIVRQLWDKGINKLYVFPEFYFHQTESEINCEEILVPIDGGKPRLKYLEYHICDHCNLNCKGCGHFSNLVKEPVYGNLEQFQKDMVRLKELLWGIEKIRLLGGEPLLNPQLPLFIKAARDAFPDAGIVVVTNGLMIEKTSEEIFSCMRQYNASFFVSCYPVTVHKVTIIKMICNIKNIKCEISPPIKEFYKFFKNREDDTPIERIYEVCEQKSCTFLKDGYISVCGNAFLYEIWNRTFDLKYHVSDEDVIDIYEDLNGWELLSRLYQPIPLCRYCAENLEPFEWELSGQGNKCIQDWQVKNK